MNFLTEMKKLLRREEIFVIMDKISEVCLLTGGNADGKAT